MAKSRRAKAQLRHNLSDPQKIAHSLFVAELMRKLAEHLGEDAELWEVVGICHDFDEEVTREDRSKHGLLTAEWLANDLPAEALDAIKAHDHRTGFVSETPLADGLKLADTLAISDQAVGREIMLGLNSKEGIVRFKSVTAERPFLFDIIEERADRLGVWFERLSELLKTMDEQNAK